MCSKSMYGVSDLYAPGTCVDHGSLIIIKLMANNLQLYRYTL